MAPYQGAKSSKGKGALLTTLIEVKGRARGDSQESSLFREAEPKRRMHTKTPTPPDPCTPPATAPRVVSPEPVQESGSWSGDTFKQRILQDTQDSTNTDPVGVDSLQLSEHHLN